MFFGSEERLRFTTFCNPERANVVIKSPVLLSVACPFYVLLLGCLVNAIVMINNCKLLQIIIRLITEGSEWPEQNLTKGNGSAIVSTTV